MYLCLLNYLKNVFIHYPNVIYAIAYLYKLSSSFLAGMDIIGPVLEIVKLAWGPIGCRIGYNKNLKKNMKELNKHDFFAARDDVLNKINSNKPNEVCNK